MMQIFMMVTRCNTLYGGKDCFRKKKGGGNGWQFMKFTPEHLAFYENMTVFLSSQRDTIGSESEDNGSVEITAETHNNLLTECALF